MKTKYYVYRSARRFHVFGLQILKETDKSYWLENGRVRRKGTSTILGRYHFQDMPDWRLVGDTPEEAVSLYKKYLISEKEIAQSKLKSAQSALRAAEDNVIAFENLADELLDNSS